KPCTYDVLDLLLELRNQSVLLGQMRVLLGQHRVQLRLNLINLRLKLTILRLQLIIVRLKLEILHVCVLQSPLKAVVLAPQETGFPLSTFEVPGALVELVGLYPDIRCVELPDVCVVPVATVAIEVRD
ncbi:hypothetical protein AAVH_30334, partial [Aphelenchoides avenae]